MHNTVLAWYRGALVRVALVTRGRWGMVYARNPTTGQIVGMVAHKSTTPQE